MYILHRNYSLIKDAVFCITVHLYDILNNIFKAILLEDLQIVFTACIDDFYFFRYSMSELS